MKSTKNSTACDVRRQRHLTPLRCSAGVQDALRARRHSSLQRAIR